MTRPTTIRGVLDEIEMDPALRLQLKDRLGRLSRAGHLIDDLPPLPDYPHTRFVLDSIGEKPPVFNHPGIANTRTFLAFLALAGESRRYEIKLIRGVTATRPADPIPERVERAIAAALQSRGAPLTVDSVRRIWESTKED